MNTKQKGFSGTTHFEIGILIICIVWMSSYFSPYVDVVKSKGMLLVIMFWGVYLGSTLLPDLDNNMSTAGFRLSLLGKVFTMFAQLTSSIVWNIIRFKNERCETQHRKLWHTPFIYICVYFLVRLTENIKYDSVFDIFRKLFTGKIMFNTSISLIILFWLFEGCAFLIFANMICYNTGKILTILKPYTSAFSTILSVLGFVYLLFIPLKIIQFLWFAVCIGCLAHIIGDYFSVGGVPLLFPIPVKHRFWFLFQLPVFAIETMSVKNKILDFILLFVDIFLFLQVMGVKII